MRWKQTEESILDEIKMLQKHLVHVSYYFDTLSHPYMVYLGKRIDHRINQLHALWYSTTKE